MSHQVQSSLSPLACVVRAEFPGLKDTYSTCGVMLRPGEGILLTHGSILAEFCASDNSLLSKIESAEVISSTDLNGCSFTALLDKCWRPVNLSLTHSLTSEREGSNPNGHQGDSSFSPSKCRVLGAIRAGDFHDAVCKIMPEDSWTFASGAEEDSITPTSSKNHTEKSDEISKNLSFQLLSYFVLLQCSPLVYQAETSEEQMFRKLLAERPLREEPCIIGTEAEIISTPFGGLNPHVFFNSYSKGVISNVHGPNGCWILTDARCIPGSEGGPLFTVQQDGKR